MSRFIGTHTVPVYLFGILAFGGLIASGAPMRTYAAQGASAQQVVSPGFVGADTDTYQHDGAPRIRLYAAPVGYPRVGSWLRDLSLTDVSTLPATAPGVAGGAQALSIPTSLQAGAFAPQGVPFALRISGRSTRVSGSGATPLVYLGRGNGAGLGLSPSQLVGGATADVAGQVQANAVAYPAGIATGDLSVRSTATGFSVRAVIHSAGHGNTVTLDLQPDAGARLEQQATGQIAVIRDQPTYSDTGAQTGTQPMPGTIIEAPVVRDASPDPAAQGASAPASLALATAGGNQSVTVTIEPAWLQNPARIFPVTVDLPVADAIEASKSGLFGTLSSCAPNAPAPISRVVVGTVNGCRYRGLLRFDVSGILSYTIVQSAILNLYTPTAAEATGISVYQNAPMADVVHALPPASWQPPSWASAPAYSSPGSASSGHAGHWQQWDITGALQQWVAKGWQSNAGLTLASDGTPILLASPSGAGDDPPATAPRLDITFGPSPASSPVLSNTFVSPNAVPPNNPQYDGASTIFGISQGIARDSGDCSQGSMRCGLGIVSGALRPSLGAQFARLQVNVDCAQDPRTLQYVQTPGFNWWNGGSGGTHIYDAMRDAYNDQLIPVVVFDSACPLDAGSWSAQLQDFTKGLGFEPGMKNPLPETYFEIMNEPNTSPNWNSNGYYQNVYSSAAQALTAAVRNYNSDHGSMRGRVLTGGLSAPDDGICGSGGITAIRAAITQAAQTVSRGFLGVALHPYGYAVPYSQQTVPKNFVNFGQDHQNATTNSCTQLDRMINLWLGDSTFQGMPLVFTETNVSSSPGLTTSQSGEYMVDFFTWLRLYGPPGSSIPWTDPNWQPIRVLWFTGVDFYVQGSLRPFGIYNTSGNDKATSVGYRYPNPAFTYGLWCPDISSVNQRDSNLSFLFAAVQGNYCWDYSS